MGTYPNPGIAKGAVGPTQLATVPAVRAGGKPGFQVADKSTTVIPFAETPSTFEFDTDAMHDATGPNPERLTARTAGIYLIYTLVSWSANSGGDRELRLRQIPPRAARKTRSSAESPPSTAPPPSRTPCAS